MSRILRPRSVRMRLTLWYGGALTAALLAYAVFVFFFLWHSLSMELDRRIGEDLTRAEQTLELKNGRVTWDAEVLNLAGNEADEADESRRENRRGGETKERETEERRNRAAVAKRLREPMIAVLNPEGKALLQSSTYKKIDPIEDRILTRNVTRDRKQFTIRAARSAEPMWRELGRLLLVLALGIPLAVLLAASGGYALARRALAPVGSMTQRAKAITAERLSERLPIENSEDELGNLATVFNETFARLERSFEQLRRFTADASHELRTPLTAIRSVGEVGLRERRSAEEYREIVGSMLEESDRLARLVDSLLTLSRADGGQIKLQRQPEDLAALARDVASHLIVLAEEKGQTLVLEAGEPVSVEVDHVVLRQALINLVDNAIKYSPEGTPIRIVARAEAGRAVLEVIDGGPGIAPEHREHIFERFYRVDLARSRQLGGAGLGLAIARWAVESHGGRIELVEQDGAGCHFRIILPR